MMILLLTTALVIGSDVHSGDGGGGGGGGGTSAGIVAGADQPRTHSSSASSAAAAAAAEAEDYAESDVAGVRDEGPAKALAAYQEQAGQQSDTMAVAVYDLASLPAETDVYPYGIVQQAQWRHVKEKDKVGCLLKDSFGNVVVFFPNTDSQGGLGEEYIKVIYGHPFAQGYDNNWYPIRRVSVYTGTPIEGETVQVEKTGKYWFEITDRYGQYPTAIGREVEVYGAPDGVKCYTRNGNVLMPKAIVHAWYARAQSERDRAAAAAAGEGAVVPHTSAKAGISLGEEEVQDL